MQNEDNYRMEVDEQPSTRDDEIEMKADAEAKKIANDFKKEIKRIYRQRHEPAKVSPENVLGTYQTTKDKKANIEFKTIKEFTKSTKKGWQDAKGGSGFLTYNTNFNGQWPDLVATESKQSFTGKRVAQFLRHLATVLYHYVTLGINKGEYEIQCLSANRRIVVAANDEASTTGLYNQLQAKQWGSMIGSAAVESDDRTKRAAGKLAALYAEGTVNRISSHITSAQERFRKGVWAQLAPLHGLLSETGSDEVEIAIADLVNRINLAVRSGGAGTPINTGWGSVTDHSLDSGWRRPLAELVEWVDVAHLAELVANAVKNPGEMIDECTLSDLGTHLDAAEKENHIIIVSAETELHAEQHLVIGYLRSTKRTPGVIRGKKRPCVACYLTLVYARDKFQADLDFELTPGGLWDTPARGFIHAMGFSGHKVDVSDFVSKMPSILYQTEASEEALKDQSLISAAVANAFVGPNVSSLYMLGQTRPSAQDKEKKLKRKGPMPGLAGHGADSDSDNGEWEAHAADYPRPTSTDPNPRPTQRRRGSDEPRWSRNAILAQIVNDYRTPGEIINDLDPSTSHTAGETQAVRKILDDMDKEGIVEKRKRSGGGRGRRPFEFKKK